MPSGLESGGVWLDGKLRTCDCPRLSAAALAASGHFEEQHAAVLRYLRCIAGNQADAEELTQETFLRLYVEIRERCEPANAQAWIFRVAHNLAIDHIRRRGAASATVNLDDVAADLADGSDSAEQKIIERERQQRVQQALAWLSPQQRQCLELRAEGLRYREISDVLGIQISSVRTFIVRAVARIAGRTDV